MYPFHIYPEKEFKRITFEPITIFYGGNGSGKTTLLNIISSKLNAERKNILKMGELFESYVGRTYCELERMSQCKEIKYIASDDVFDFLLDIRTINTGVNRRKEELEEEYSKVKYEKIDYSIPDYEKIKNNVDARRMSVSKYIKKRLVNNKFIQQSNGESALRFWEEEIKDHAIYILDEPENSLSAENQIKLKQFLEESARFYNCQFIISTHSPFILSLEGAKVYDLDSVPVESKSWTDLENVRAYYNFFKIHSNEFEDKSEEIIHKRIRLTSENDIIE